MLKKEIRRLRKINIPIYFKFNFLKLKIRLKSFIDFNFKTVNIDVEVSFNSKYKHSDIECLVINKSNGIKYYAYPQSLQSVIVKNSYSIDFLYKRTRNKYVLSIKKAVIMDDYMQVCAIKDIKNIKSITAHCFDGTEHKISRIRFYNHRRYVYIIFI